VRTAGASESMTLLDGKMIDLPEGALLITDEEGPIAFAGVMGGQRTAISATTTAVVLESAFFAPHALAGQARKLGMHTDASHRFERGVDFALAERALDRATGLLISLTGGQAGPVSVVRHDDQLPSRDPVKLNARALQRALGVAIESKEVDHILNGLGLDTQATPEGWICSVPSWRFDIAIEADLIEEVARIYGYNKLPVSQIYAALDMPIKPETATPASRIRRYLAARDLREVITYSFIEPKLAEAFGDMASAVVLRNPISEDLSVMRSVLFRA
jgi:Phenylalanyl-tRNA synthetase beta subunit